MIMNRLLLITSMISGSLAANQKTAAYIDPNPSARWGTINKSNVFIGTELLWLKPVSIDQTIYYNNSFPPSNPLQSNSFFSYNYQPAFRCTIGYNTSYNDWELDLIYTRLNYKKSEYLEYTSINSSNVRGYFQEGREKITYLYNLIDLNLGRPFKISQSMRIHPFFGIRSLIYSKKNSIKATYSSPIYNTYDSVSNGKISATLVGLNGSFDVIFSFFKDFSVYSKIGAAVLINSQKNNYDYKDNDQTYTAIDYATFKQSTLATNVFDFHLGLRWDRYLAREKYHIGINLGYEMHNYWYMHARSPFAVTNNSFLSGFAYDFTFALQGFALGARFDF